MEGLHACGSKHPEGMSTEELEVRMTSRDREMAGRGTEMPTLRHAQHHHPKVFDTKGEEKKGERGQMAGRVEFQERLGIL